MNWFGVIVVFVVVWWLVFFATLPWGVRRDTGPGDGHDPGAPANPRLWLKVGVTTAIAVVVTLAIWLVAESDLISFRS